MDPALDLLNALRRRGIVVRRHGDRLAVQPAGRLYDDDRAALRTHRDELLEILCRPHTGPCGELVIPFESEDRFCWWKTRAARIHPARGARGRAAKTFD